VVNSALTEHFDKRRFDRMTKLLFVRIGKSGDYFPPPVGARSSSNGSTENIF
jgi:hypothetical protein